MEHKGQYHDGIHEKRNEVVLTLQDGLWSGLACGGVAHLHMLRERVGKDSGRRDGTEYAIGDWEGDEFMPHYTQLLSVAVIRANAQRGLKKTRALRQRYCRGDVGRGERE